MKKKFFIATTIPLTLNSFFKGNLAFLNETFDVCAISSEKEALKLFGEREGVRTYYIPMGRPVSFFRDFVSLFRFIWFFLKEHPDIVHGNTPKASMLSMVAAKLTGVKSRIYMCHGLRYQGETGQLRYLLKKMEKLSCACATEVFCVSQGIRKTLIEDGICTKDKAVVIHHGSASGIDLDKFKADKSSFHKENIRQKLGIELNEFVFIFIGRIVGDKGINELINAFVRLQKSIKSVHLILVGDDERKLYPISYLGRKHINENKKIHSVGKHEDIRPFLSISGALVLPSYREGFGMVLIEAGAMGLPCITTDISGCNEIIIHGVNGEIIPPRDENALYEKMKEWLENPEKVASMGSKARSLVQNRYDQKVVWSALLAEYQRLTN